MYRSTRGGVSRSIPLKAWSVYPRRVLKGVCMTVPEVAFGYERHSTVRPGHLAASNEESHGRLAAPVSFVIPCINLRVVIVRDVVVRSSERRKSGPVGVIWTPSSHRPIRTSSVWSGNARRCLGTRGSVNCVLTYVGLRPTSPWARWISSVFVEQGRERG